MKFRVTKASDHRMSDYEVEFSCLEDLVNLSNQYEGEELILTFFQDDKLDGEITIYDYYIE